MSPSEIQNVIELPASITVRDLAKALNASPIEVIKTLMGYGKMANINELIDYDTAEIVATEMGHEVTQESIEPDEDEGAGEVPFWRRLIANEKVADLTARPPVVTILGHVDHGKTSLLDAIRDTKVQSGEAGGITQHIGAYQITHNGRKITFLDTPGHAAFTAMRARGAQGADIVILVIAADDGIMPQTREAIAHAQAARVPMIVALNKIDRSNANPDRVKNQLAEIGLQPDEWDGDTIIVPVSATERTGLEDLLEAILLVADNTDIRANVRGRVIGTVIEAERDQRRGVFATLLVQNGTLKLGNVVLAGTAYGRIKAMFDFNGNPLKTAGPSTPVAIMGLSDVPRAGDLFQVIKNEKEARVIADEREEQKKQRDISNQIPVTLEKLFAKFEAGELRELRLIIKADVQGSLEPIINSLNDLEVGDISLNILHAGTGNIGEGDIMLATASEAIVIGFNNKIDDAAHRLAEIEGVSVRSYKIIYRLIDDIEKALKGLLEPEIREVELGRAEVRATFRIRRIGLVAGCFVLEGEIRRNARAAVLRKDKVIYDGVLGSLKRHEEDVTEVRRGFECGINVKGFETFEEGDIIRSYIMEEVPVF